MTRLVSFLLAILGLSFAFSWLADNPGTIIVNWQGYHAEPTVFQVVVLTALVVVAGIIAWAIVRYIWTSPAAVSHFLTKRRQQRGLDALSSGMIAIGAGDRASATRYALQARKSLPNEPLTHLLRAQAAQLSGDGATSRRIFEAMLSAPDTEQLGLRGLYLEAAREGESEVQRQFAERAIALNPKLTWPVEGLFDLQCKDGDWTGALATLDVSRRHGTLDKSTIDRRRAVLLTGQAIALEDSQSEKALGLALEAHALAKDLIPAAALAGRLLAARGNTAKAAKVIQRTWARAPHPDLAMAYAYARIGDSPRDRLDRVRQLAALNPHASEGSIAVAQAAIEARDFDEARDALSPLLEGRLTRRVATLMARLEKEQHGDKGRVREWLARAVHAGRDPAWTADGIVAESWSPVSPVTGALDAFQWRVPVEEFDTASSVTGSTSPLDEFMALEAVLDHTPPAAGSFDADMDEKTSLAEVTANISTPPAHPADAPRQSRVVADTPGRARTAAPMNRQRSPAREAEVVVSHPINKQGRADLASNAASAAAEVFGADENSHTDEEVRVTRSPAARLNRTRGTTVETATTSGGSSDDLGGRSTSPVKLNRQPVQPAKDRASERPTAAKVTPVATQRRNIPGPHSNAGQKGRSDTAVLVPLHAPDDPGFDPDSDGQDDDGRTWPYRAS